MFNYAREIRVFELALMLHYIVLTNSDAQVVHEDSLHFECSCPDRTHVVHLEISQSAALDLDNNRQCFYAWTHLLDGPVIYA